MTYEVKKDPQGRENHWIVNGQLVAGAKTSDEAIDIVKSLDLEEITESIPDFYVISKLTILKRLQAAGKYDAARAALDASDAFTQDLWGAAQEIRSDDEIVITLLNAIGADIAEILARE